MCLQIKMKAYELSGKSVLSCSSINILVNLFKYKFIRKHWSESGLIIDSLMDYKREEVTLYPLYTFLSFSMIMSFNVFIALNLYIWYQWHYEKLYLTFKKGTHQPDSYLNDLSCFFTMRLLLVYMCQYRSHIDHMVWHQVGGHLPGWPACIFTPRASCR